MERFDSQRRFLAQKSVAIMEQCCSNSKQCRNNDATLCCAKNRRRESSRVTRLNVFCFLCVRGRSHLILCNRHCKMAKNLHKYFFKTNANDGN